MSFVLNEDGTIAGYTSGGADTVHPFKSSNEIWNNPDTTVAFSPQTIVFENNYSTYAIFMTYSIHENTDNVRINIVSSDSNEYTVYSNLSMGGYTAQRTVTAEPTSITFSDESQSWGNEYGLPKMIIGLY